MNGFVAFLQIVGMVLLGGTVVYGWALFAFLHYRHCRRAELLDVLAGAADGGMQLGGAVRAYVEDRPHGPLRNWWVASLLFFIPGPGYYWLWHRRHHFDRRVLGLAQRLEQGMPLHQALQAIPGLAARETVLAAAIGETTGQLGHCLRMAVGRRLTGLFLAQLPRMIYPLVMLVVVGSVVGFLTYFIVPKVQRIFADFGADLPELTVRVVSIGDQMTRHAWLTLFSLQAAAVLSVLMVFSSTVRWYCPGVGTIYRRLARSRVLQTLALLLSTGKPLPESMRLLESLPLGRAIVRRVEAARFRVERGEPLGESLLDAGLLPSAFLPLVHAAERANNLPWAFRELAENLLQRTVKVVERVTQAIFPVMVVIFGFIVAFVVLAFFLPLISLIGELAK